MYPPADDFGDFISDDFGTFEASSPGYPTLLDFMGNEGVAPELRSESEEKDERHLTCECRCIIGIMGSKDTLPRPGYLCEENEAHNRMKWMSDMTSIVTYGGDNHLIPPTEPFIYPLGNGQKIYYNSETEQLMVADALPMRSVGVVVRQWVEEAPDEELASSLEDLPEWHLLIKALIDHKDRPFFRECCEYTQIYETNLNAGLFVTEWDDYDNFPPEVDWTTENLQKALLQSNLPATPATAEYLWGRLKGGDNNPPSWPSRGVLVSSFCTWAHAPWRYCQMLWMKVRESSSDPFQ